jgi:hypothetical protein
VETTTTPGSPVIDKTRNAEERQPYSPVLPPALQRTVVEITGLPLLPRGWDSYGADPVSERAMHRAIAFLTMLATHPERSIPPPVVGPSVNGGVVLQWDIGTREVVVTLLPDGGEFYVAERDSHEAAIEGEIGDLEASIRRIAPYLA